MVGNSKDFPDNVKHSDVGVEAAAVQEKAIIDDESLGVRGKILTSPSSSPAEDRLRSRIDGFLNGYGLTPMGKSVALSWIQAIGADTCGEYARVRGWLLDRLNAFGKQARSSSRACATGERAASTKAISPWQKGCPELILGLRSKEFWNTRELPWVKDFEKGFSDVKNELMALRGREGFQPYRAPRGGSCDRPASDGVGSYCHDGGDWNVFYLFLHNVDFSENRSMCPKTCALIETLPRQYEHAFFSALAPGTHIIKHHGPTNKKLRVHLPLVTPGGGLSRIRVGSRTEEARAGQALIFDDSFEHEAWNEATTAAVAAAATDSNSASVSSLHKKNNPSLASPSRHEAEGIMPKQEGEGPAAVTVGDGNGVPGPRVTLIADIWHPDLSWGEVRFLRFLQQAALRVEKRMVERAVQGGVASPHDFVSHYERSCGSPMGADREEEVGRGEEWRHHPSTSTTMTTAAAADAEKCHDVANRKHSNSNNSNNKSRESAMARQWHSKKSGGRKEEVEQQEQHQQEQHQWSSSSSSAASSDSAGATVSKRCYIEVTHDGAKCASYNTRDGSTTSGNNEITNDDNDIRETQHKTREMQTTTTTTIAAAAAAAAPTITIAVATDGQECRRRDRYSEEAKGRVSSHRDGSDAGAVMADNNFLSVISRARSLRPQESSIFGNSTSVGLD